MKVYLCGFSLILILSVLGSKDDFQSLLCEKLRLVANEYELLTPSPSKEAEDKTLDFDAPLSCGLDWNTEKIVLKAFGDVPEKYYSAFYYNDDPTLPKDQIEGKLLFVPEKVFKLWEACTSSLHLNGYRLDLAGGIVERNGDLMAFVIDSTTGRAYELKADGKREGLIRVLKSMRQSYDAQSDLSSSQRYIQLLNKLNPTQQQLQQRQHLKRWREALVEDLKRLKVEKDDLGQQIKLLRLHQKASSKTHDKLDSKGKELLQKAEELQGHPPALKDELNVRKLKTQKLRTKTEDLVKWQQYILDQCEDMKQMLKETTAQQQAVRAELRELDANLFSFKLLIYRDSGHVVTETAESFPNLSLRKGLVSNYSCLELHTILVVRLVQMIKQFKADLSPLDTISLDGPVIGPINELIESFDETASDEVKDVFYKRLLSKALELVPKSSIVPHCAVSCCLNAMASLDNHFRSFFVNPDPKATLFHLFKSSMAFDQMTFNDLALEQLLPCQITVEVIPLSFTTHVDTLRDVNFRLFAFISNAGVLYIFQEKHNDMIIRVHGQDAEVRTLVFDLGRDANATPTLELVGEGIAFYRHH